MTQAWKLTSMDKRIANLYLTARRAGVCMDEPLPHFHQMLQAVICLCQACDLPLHYRFRPGASAPVSQQLRVDHVAYLENPSLYIEGTKGRDLFHAYAVMVDPVRYLKEMTPQGTQMLTWMQTAAAIHCTSAERRLPYFKAVQRVMAEQPQNQQLIEPVLAAMERCDIRPRWERKLSIPQTEAPMS